MQFQANILDKKKVARIPRPNNEEIKKCKIIVIKTIHKKLGISILTWLITAHGAFWDNVTSETPGGVSIAE